MKRILISLLIAVVGIALSWRFLRPQEWSANDGKNKEIVARVVTTRNDVNRQGEGRLLWSPVRKGDEIYLGDKIKTAGLSSIVIEFNDSSSKLEIEENSMIVMSQAGKKLALNMLEGRVFLKQEEGASDQQVDLLSGGKKVDLKGNGAVSVSKDGQVQSFNSQGNLFSDLRPEYSEDILSSQNNLSLFWKPASRAERVEVYVGESPLLLKKAEGVSATFQNGKVEVVMRPGINYWQLVSKIGETETRSQLMKLNLIRPLPPTPLFPSDREVIKVQERPFDFKWMKGNTGDSVFVEVARDQNFSQIVASEEVKDQTFFTPRDNLPEGEFFWRVRSKLKKGDWIESKPVSFTVHKGSNIVSPAPLFPTDNAVFYLSKSGAVNVKFEWRKQENVRGYELKLMGEGLAKDTQIAETSSTIALGRPGKYTWEVFAEGLDGKRSVLPIKRKFEIREAGVVQWMMPQKNFMFLESLPIIILKWEKKAPGISVLKISRSPDLREAETFQVQGKDFPYRVLQEGIYFASVTVVDETGQTAAESPVFEFKVQEAPLPPAPVLAGEAKKLRASSSGDLKTQVQNLKTSWLTIASLVDLQGRVVDERRFTDPSIAFNGLLPGKYFLQTKFQDEYRRLGEVSERIEVEVPEKSMIAAPKIKGIKVR